MRRRIDIIYPDQSLTGLQEDIKIFLAGPVAGAPDWQNQVPPIPGVTWLCPRWAKDDTRPFNHDLQVEWETTALRISDIVVFWIPAPEIEVKERSYAQTTRMEIGETLGRQEKRIIMGAYLDFPGRGYLKTKASEYGIGLLETWDDVMTSIREELRIRKEPKIFFTSDTHFGSTRALMYSQRPFQGVKTMDWAMISRWNSEVGPEDIVYHLGDFGETWPLKYLNGKIKLVPGNYDNPEDFKEYIEVLPEIYTTPEGYLLSHEPSKIREIPGDNLKLFGHIHGRQKIKEWGGIDTGVDAWGFRPVPESKIKFLWEAISSGKYDDEVWK